MFASNITASSRFHGPVQCAEACARWQAYCTRAYTIVRAAFIRFSVHFINAHRVYGSRRRQPQRVGPRLQRLASLLSRNCSEDKKLSTCYSRAPFN